METNIYVPSNVRQQEVVRQRIESANMRTNRNVLLSKIRIGDSNVNELLTLIVKTPCLLKEKMYMSCVIQLIQRNSTTVSDVKALLDGMTILEKYGRNLLKPPSLRPPMWKSVKFSNGIFKSRVDSLQDARKVLSAFGYTCEIEDGQAFPDTAEINTEYVAKITTDLMVARTALEQYIAGRSDNPNSVESLITARVTQLPNNLLEVSETVGHTFESDILLSPDLNYGRAKDNSSSSQYITNPVSDLPNMSSSYPQSQHGNATYPHLGEQQITNSSILQRRTFPGLTDPYVPHSSPLSVSTLPLSKPKSFSYQQPDQMGIATLQKRGQTLPATRQWNETLPAKSPDKQLLEYSQKQDEVCDICGQSGVEWLCSVCDDKVLCQDCDKKWHQHPKRVNHERVSISSIKSNQSNYHVYETLSTPFQSTLQTLVHDQMPDLSTSKDTSKNDISKPPSRPQRPEKPLHLRSNKLSSSSSDSGITSHQEYQITDLSRSPSQPVFSPELESWNIKQPPLPTSLVPMLENQSQGQSRNTSNFPSYSGKISYPPADESSGAPSLPSTVTTASLASTPVFELMDTCKFCGHMTDYSAPRCAACFRDIPPEYRDTVLQYVLQNKRDSKKNSQGLSSSGYSIIEPEQETLGSATLNPNKWQCRHCTVINEGNSRVCFVCSRTTDNPVIVLDRNHRETPDKGDDRISTTSKLPPFQHIASPSGQSENEYHMYSRPMTIQPVAPKQVLPSGGQTGSGISTSSRPKLAYPPVIQTVREQLVDPPVSQLIRPEPDYPWVSQPVGPQSSYQPVSQLGQPIGPQPGYPLVSQTVGPQPGYPLVSQTVRPQPGYPPVSQTVRSQPGYPPVSQTVRPQQGYPLVSQTVRPQPGYPLVSQTVRPQPGYPPVSQTVGPQRGYPQVGQSTLTSSSSMSYSSAQQQAVKQTPEATYRSMFVDIQDDIAREKKEAHEKFRKQLELEEAEKSKQQQTSYVQSGGHLSDIKGLQSPLDSTTVQNIPSTLSLQYDTTPSHLLSGQKVNSTLQSSNHKQPGQSNVQSQYGAARSSFSSPPSSLENKSLGSDLVHFETLKMQEDLITHGKRMIQLFRLALNEGFSSAELTFGLRQDGEHPISWLKNKFSDLGETVADIASAQLTVGRISIAEAKHALVKHGGDITMAANRCIRDRKQQVKEIEEYDDFELTDVYNTLLQCQGDVNAAVDHLYLQRLQPITAQHMEAHKNRKSNFNLQDLELIHTLKNKKIDFERRVRLIFAEACLVSWGRATTVISILDMEGVDFEVTDIVDAVVNSHGDIATCLNYLQKECAICMSELPMSKIYMLVHCQCMICVDCIKQNFEITIRERNVKTMVCPVCELPDVENPEVADTHFSLLDTMLKGLVDAETHELFQRKLRDWNLMKDLNFRWCSHCANGFIFAPERLGQLAMPCPHCHKKTCFQCKKPWEEQHQGLTCEQFQQWKEDNDPEAQAAGVARHLQENGIECPQCKYRYVLAKGGCMHFKCIQCGHEFCSGCYNPFKRQENCRLYETCARAGLHCHHPRDCLYHLRDNDIKELQHLLKDHKVKYNTAPPESNTGTCQVMEQKEDANGLTDDMCGKPVEANTAGLCNIHYKEYLVSLINKQHIDPVVMMDEKDLKILLRRECKDVPNRGEAETKKQYRLKLIQNIEREIPLPKRPMQER